MGPSILSVVDLFSKYTLAGTLMPCRSSWTRGRTSCCWLCRATRAMKCMQNPSSHCSNPGTFTSSKPCRAQFIAAWQPTGCRILLMSQPPPCTPTTPQISAVSMAPHAVNWANAERIWEWLYSPWCHSLLAWGISASHLVTTLGWARPNVILLKATRTTGSRGSSMWRPCKTPALWLMWWQMLQANLSRGPSMDQNCRRSHCHTTVMWRPNWTCAGTGAPLSTWLSWPDTYSVSTPGKVTRSDKVATFTEWDIPSTL